MTSLLPKKKKDPKAYIKKCKEPSSPFLHALPNRGGFHALGPQHPRVGKKLEPLASLKLVCSGTSTGRFEPCPISVK